MSGQEITVLVNGDPMELSRGACVKDAVRAFGLDPDSTKGIAVAVNDEVVRREDWPDVPVGPSDRVEIVTAQQGG